MKENNYNGPITMELVYSDNYSNMEIEDFYKKGYEIGKKLAVMFEEDTVL